jgi:beta-lactam-binding protein with PASTA domain
MSTSAGSPEEDRAPQNAIAKLSSAAKVSAVNLRVVAERIGGWVKHHPARAASMAGIVLLIVGGSVSWAAVESRRIVVPDLVGTTLQEAMASAMHVSLVANSREPLPGDELLGFTRVLSQAPAAGSRVFPDAVIELDYEMLEVRMPSVVGLSLASAQTLFAAHGLSSTQDLAELVLEDIGIEEGEALSASDVAQVQSIASELQLSAVDYTGKPFELSSAAGHSSWTVISADVNNGAMLKAGSTVNVTLALPISRVPTVVGMTFIEASRLLSESGIGSLSPGSVFAAPLPADFQLDLDYLSRSYWGSAESADLKANLGTPSTWLVVAQSVPAGELVVNNTTTLELTTSWPSATVPNLALMTGSEASEALHAAGLSSRDVASSNDGLVRSQTISAGTIVPAGTRVGADILHEVIFSVTSSSRRALITWIAPGSFSIQQANGAAVPWSAAWYPYSAPGAYDRGNFSAQNSGGGWITCEIIIDGAVVVSNTSTGAYAVVSCS